MPFVLYCTIFMQVTRWATTQLSHMQYCLERNLRNILKQEYFNHIHVWLENWFHTS